MGLLSTLKSYASKAVSTVKSLASTGVSTARSVYSGARQAVSSAISTGTSYVRSGVSKLSTLAQSTAGTARRVLTSNLSRIKTAVKQKLAAASAVTKARLAKIASVGLASATAAAKIARYGSSVLVSSKDRIVAAVKKRLDAIKARSAGTAEPEPAKTDESTSEGTVRQVDPGVPGYTGPTPYDPGYVAPWLGPDEAGDVPDWRQEDQTDPGLWDEISKWIHEKYADLPTDLAPYVDGYDGYVNAGGGGIDDYIGTLTGENKLSNNELQQIADVLKGQEVGGDKMDEQTVGKVQKALTIVAVVSGLIAVVIYFYRKQKK